MNRPRIRLQFSLRIVLLTVLVTSFGVWRFTPQIRAALVRLTAKVPDAPFKSTPTVATARVWTSFQAMHDWYEKTFIESENGFGFSRMIDFDSPWLRHIEVNGQLYRVSRSELVSLKHDEGPLAYINEFRSPVKESYKQAETRALTDFERSALKKLQKGRQFVYNGEAAHPRFLGAIRARASCLSCHDAKVGDLLGSFAYELEPAAQTQLQFTTLLRQDL